MSPEPPQLGTSGRGLAGRGFINRSMPRGTFAVKFTAYSIRRAIAITSGSSPIPRTRATLQLLASYIYPSSASQCHGNGDNLCSVDAFFTSVLSSICAVVRTPGRGRNSPQAKVPPSGCSCPSVSHRTPV